ncbi:hypothetical protein Tsubulata_048141 [Turnera subulata]|uniref:Uncharacterized protein n=1 Tax=Turnera subulata TaxID=218843 RepID=A0A9Q0F1M1_9ROSI|nr:hypothetical protein Tsubulata_048141 [Turnera subulata]
MSVPLPRFHEEQNVGMFAPYQVTNGTNCSGPPNSPAVPADANHWARRGCSTVTFAASCVVDPSSSVPRLFSSIPSIGKLKNSTAFRLLWVWYVVIWLDMDEDYYPRDQAASLVSEKLAQRSHRNREDQDYAGSERDQPAQSVEEIMRIIQEAKTPGEGAKVGEQALGGTSDDLDADLDLEVDVSGDFFDQELYCRESAFALSY